MEIERPRPRPIQSKRHNFNAMDVDSVQTSSSSSSSPALLPPTILPFTPNAGIVTSAANEKPNTPRISTIAGTGTRHGVNPSSPYRLPLLLKTNDVPQHKWDHLCKICAAMHSILRIEIQNYVKEKRQQQQQQVSITQRKRPTAIGFTPKERKVLWHMMKHNNSKRNKNNNQERKPVPILPSVASPVQETPGEKVSMAAENALQKANELLNPYGIQAELIFVHKEIPYNNRRYQQPKTASKDLTTITTTLSIPTGLNFTVMQDQHQ